MSEPSPTTPPDVLVVGGGPSGLAAAITAAEAGARVTVAEARRDPGGRARTRITDHGVHFNQGPHAVYVGGAADRFVSGRGVRLRGRRTDARGSVRVDGQLERFPTPPWDSVRTRALSVADKVELGRTMLRPAALLDDEPGTGSMAEWIDRRLSRDRTRSLLAMLARVATYVDDPATISADAAAPQLVAAATTGVRYLDGGWSQLVDALVGLATARGVTIRPEAKVTRIEAGTSEGVGLATTAGELTAARVVLAGLAPAQVDDLVGGLPSTSTWAASALPVHAASLDVALRRLPVPDRRITFPLDAPLYLSVHTPYGNLAPDGIEVLHVMRYGDGEADPRPELEELLDQAQPGWRDEVVDERYGRRLVVAHGRPLPGAGLPGRPGPEVPGAPGVFVAGDWVGPEGLLVDAAVSSGATAGRLAAAPAAEPAAVG